MAIIGQAEAEFSYDDTYTVTGKSELGKEDFLTLLVAQLQNQDPLNPMEDKEFTAQLAQFSSLEQLTEISSGINTMTAKTTQQDMFSAVNFIGKSVRATGNSLSKTGDTMSVVYYDLDRDVVEGLVNVFDKDGNLVSTEELSARTAGTYEFIWDGVDDNGQEMADGVYYFSMAARDEDGQAALIYPDVSGEVSGVQTENGTHYLRLTDGRVINLSLVKEVVNPATQTTDEE